MLVLGGVGLVLELLLLVYCLLDVATTPADKVRELPKPVWLLLVILLPLIGGVAWLVAGRPRPGDRAGRGPGLRRPPDRPTGPMRPSSPDDDEEFLRSLRRRAQEQRDRAQRDRELGGDDTR